MGLPNGKELHARPFKIKSETFSSTGDLTPRNIASSHLMKPLLPFSLVLCLMGVSCERHAELRREISALDATVKQDEAAVRQYDKDIAALGGKDAVSRFTEQARIKQDQMRSLEFVNGPRERKLSAIEAEFNTLKPAAEAFKAAQPK